MIKNERHCTLVINGRDCKQAKEKDAGGRLNRSGISFAASPVRDAAAGAEAGTSLSAAPAKKQWYPS